MPLRYSILFAPLLLLNPHLVRASAFLPTAQYLGVRHQRRATGCSALNAYFPENQKKDAPFTSETRQLLGLQDPAQNTELWKIRIQLSKPITWVPLSLFVACGAAASGNFHWNLHDACRGLAAMVLAGPCSEGFAQTINDWYDRDIDAVNEPYRPIPSGRITPRQVFEQLLMLFSTGLGLSVALDAASSNELPMVTFIALAGYLVSYIYSAPPLKLKQNGITGDLAICVCYIAFPWWVGQSVFGGLNQPVDWFLPLVYSLVGIGAGIVNDFKSMKGDEEFGLQSIPLLLGVDRAKWLAALFPDAVQFAMAGYLYSIGEPLAAAIVAGAVLPQIYLQKTLLLKDPFENDMKYMGMSQPFVTLGILATALCMGNHDWGAAVL